MGDAAPGPDDVVAACRSLGVEPVAVTTIGASPTWRDGRATYRVEAADGRTFKARRVPGRMDKVRRAAALAAAARHPGIPVPTGVDGSVVVDRWVEGESLAGRSMAVADVAAAADLLARLHRTTTTPEGDLPCVRSTAEVAGEMATKLAALEADGVLASPAAERLRRLLELLPDRDLEGVIHGDLCPSNLVVASTGALVSVDNEGLRIGFFAYDLARTWCRWPMPDAAWTRFRQRYAEGFPSAPPADADPAWRALAAVRSAFLWRSTPGPGQEDAFAALARLVDGSP